MAKKNNPFAICTKSVGREDPDKYERCVMDVKKQKKASVFNLKKMAKEKDKIPGGFADGQPDSKFNEEQMKAGLKIEMEHTDDKTLAKEIVKDHLMEDPKYYDHLDELEKKYIDPEVSKKLKEKDRKEKKAFNLKKIKKT